MFLLQLNYWHSPGSLLMMELFVGDASNGETKEYCSFHLVPHFEKSSLGIVSSFFENFMEHFPTPIVAGLNVSLVLNVQLMLSTR
jgi:hypothetical protein